MKKFLLSAIAVSMIASPVLIAAPASAAQRHTTVVKHKPNGRTVIKQKANRRVVRKTVYQAPQRQYRTSWRKGERFDSRYARNYRVVNNYRDYRLQAPPRGYHYVQSGNDIALVAITSGIIGAIFGGLLN